MRPLAAITLALLTLHFSGCTHWRLITDGEPTAFDMGGQSRELVMLASLAGAGSLTADDVEAWRRRDAADHRREPRP